MPNKILTSTLSVQEGNLHYYHLPKGLLQIELIQLADGNQIIDSKVITIPDPKHRYYLTYHANAFSSDVLDIEFTQKGFLKSIKTKIKDESLQIAQEVANSVKEGVGVVAGVGYRGLEGRKTLFAATFDPFDELALKRTNYNLERHGYQLDIQSIGYISDPESESGDKFPIPSPKKIGVYCRPVETFELILKSGELEQRDLITLPHPHLVHFIEIPNARFVQNTFVMNFDENGYPNSIHLEKPSQALALVKVPVNILKAILEIPAKIFSFRFNYDNQGSNSTKDKAIIQETLDKQNQQISQINQNISQIRGVKERER